MEQIFFSSIELVGYRRLLACTWFGVIVLYVHLLSTGDLNENFYLQTTGAVSINRPVGDVADLQTVLFSELSPV